MLIVASLVGLKNACTRIDPDRTQPYAEALEKMLNADFGADENAALRRARSLPTFDLKLKEAQAAFEKMPRPELARECASLLRSK